MPKTKHFTKYSNPTENPVVIEGEVLIAKTSPDSKLSLYSVPASTCVILTLIEKSERKEKKVALGHFDSSLHTKETVAQVVQEFKSDKISSNNIEAELVGGVTRFTPFLHSANIYKAINTALEEEGVPTAKHEYYSNIICTAKSYDVQLNLKDGSKKIEHEETFNRNYRLKLQERLRDRQTRYSANPAVFEGHPDADKISYSIKKFSLS